MKKTKDGHSRKLKLFYSKFQFSQKIKEYTRVASKVDGDSKISISKSRSESMDFSEAVMQEKPAGNKDTLTGKTERERKRSLIKVEPSREIP